MNEEQADALGRLIDRIDNLVAGFELPLPPSMHVEQGKLALAEISTELKAVFVEATGENPWE